VGVGSDASPHFVWLALTNFDLAHSDYHIPAPPSHFGAPRKLSLIL
jgi:hypothetical protein